MNQKKKSVKRISYKDHDNETLDIYIEEVLDANYGCYIWPSALVMSEYVWYHKTTFLNKSILEVGAGTSLPSLVLSKYSNSIQIVLSDIPSILPIIEGCLKQNDLIGTVKAIEWGTIGKINSIDQFIKNQTKTFDYIIGSDTFYEPSQFENLLVLVSFMIYQHNPNCKFITTYQERSPKRSIQYILEKWKLKCKMISKESFKFDEEKYINQDKIESEVKVNLGTLSSVFLLEISSTLN